MNQTRNPPTSGLRPATLSLKLRFPAREGGRTLGPLSVSERGLLMQEVIYEGIERRSLPQAGVNQGSLN